MHAYGGRFVICKIMLSVSGVIYLYPPPGQLFSLVVSPCEIEDDVNTIPKTFHKQLEAKNALKVNVITQGIFFETIA